MFELLVRDGVQGDRGRLPVGLAAGLRLRAQLIEEDLIPDDVTIQVLTQARPELIERTFESLRGRPARDRAPLQLDVRAAAPRRVRPRPRRHHATSPRRAPRLCRELDAHQCPSADVRYQYSPESFTGTELDFAIEICEAVHGRVGADATDRPVILNLPATVEMATPNIYADMIEWFHRNVTRRDTVIVLSLHPHNDRGTAVAAAELGVMAGADRVEGTLFGNGERTGNVDVVTLALNLFSAGRRSRARLLRHRRASARSSSTATALPVHPRHPYAGDLVYTAFSGSHQDADQEGLRGARQETTTCGRCRTCRSTRTDVGRSYEAVIRVNSQSGKGGVAYIMKFEHGLDLPRRLQIEFSSVIQKLDRGQRHRDQRRPDLGRRSRPTYLSRREPVALIGHPILTTAPETGETTIEAHAQAGDGPAGRQGPGQRPHRGVRGRARARRRHRHRDHRLQRARAGRGRRRAGGGVRRGAHRRQDALGRRPRRHIVTASLRAVVSAVNRV